MLSKTTDKELKCLCGLCDHEVFDKDCPYNQMIDKDNPDEELYKRICRLVAREVNLAVLKEKKKNGKSK